MLKLAVGIFISPTLTRFSTGFNLAGSVLDQVLDYVPWIGNGHRYGNNHRGVDDITALKTGAGSSSGTSTNTSGSRSFLPTFSNVGVGLKANVQGTLGGSQTTTTGKDIPKWPTLDPAKLQLWTGAGWRNDKASNKQSDENHTTFKSATGSGQQGGSTTGGSAGNPDSLKQDKISKSGQNLTTQDGAPQSNSTTESASNYDHLPPNLTPTSDWPNALSFTNKNNAQRAQLFLRGLLGSIPVLVNRSGSDDSNKFQATDQKWSYTDLKSDQTKLNLPAYGEVNGLLNPALVETYFGTTRAGGSGSNTTSSPGIGFKIPEQNNDSKAVLITPGLAWTPQDVGNLVVSGTSLSFQLGGWLVTFTDFVKPRAGYLGLQLTGLDASDATQRALIWAKRPWAAFRGSWVNRLGRVESVWDLKGVWQDQAQAAAQAATTAAATGDALPEHPNALAYQISSTDKDSYKASTQSSGQTNSQNTSPYLHLIKPKKVENTTQLDQGLKTCWTPTRFAPSCAKALVQTIPPKPNPNPSKQPHRCLGRIVVTLAVCLVVGVLEEQTAPIRWTSPPLNGWVGGLWGNYPVGVGGIVVRILKVCKTLLFISIFISIFFLNCSLTLFIWTTASLATGLTVVGHFTSTTTTLKRQQFSYTRPDEVALRHTNAINPRLTPWTYRNTSFSSLPLTGENPGAWALVRDNTAKGITAGSGSQQTTYDPTRTEAALTTATTFVLRRYDLAGRCTTSTFRS